MYGLLSLSLWDDDTHMWVQNTYVCTYIHMMMMNSVTLKFLTVT